MAILEILAIVVILFILEEEFDTWHITPKK